MKRVFLVALLTITSGLAAAADGDLDPSFGASSFSGVATVAFDRASSNFDDRATAAVATALGIVVVGAVASSSGGTDIGVVRLTYSGLLDTTFGTMGRTIVPIDIVAGGIDRPNNVALDPVGRIIIGAGASTGQGAAPVLIRLSANGLLDGSFGTGGFRVIGDNQYTFRGTGAFAVAGSDSAVYYAAVAQSVNSGSAQLFYVGKLPANGLGDSVFGSNGRVAIAFGSSPANIIGDFRLSGSSELLICGGANSGSNAIWAFASITTDATFPFSSLVEASESPTPNAGDHICTSVMRSRFFAGRVYLGGGGKVAGKNGVVVAAVGIGGTPDTRFSGDGFYRSTLLDGQTYVTLDDLVERSSGELMFTGSVDRPGTGTDAYASFLLNSGLPASSGTKIYELFEDSRGSRATSVLERDSHTYVVGWLQFGPTDPGDFDYLVLKTVAGDGVFAHGFE